MNTPFEFIDGHLYLRHVILAMTSDKILTQDNIY